MEPRTRVDKVVWLRERAEDGALASLARARAEADEARAQVEKARQETQRDGRGTGPAELWVLEEAGHRRAVQTLHAAETKAQRAAEAASAALGGYTAARQDTLVVRRVQERRRADHRAELQKRERRTLDEVATQRFNSRA